MRYDYRLVTTFESARTSVEASTCGKTPDLVLGKKAAGWLKSKSCRSMPCRPARRQVWKHVHMGEAPSLFWCKSNGPCSRGDHVGECHVGLSGSVGKRDYDPCSGLSDRAELLCI